MLQSGLFTRADRSVGIPDVLVAILDESGLRSVVKLPPEHLNQWKIAKGRSLLLEVVFYLLTVGGLAGQRPN